MALRRRANLLLMSAARHECHRRLQCCCGITTASSSLSAAFNRRPSKRFSFSLRPKHQTGLFGYPELTTADGFHLMKQNACAKTEALMREATDSGGRTRSLLRIFDEMSDTICRAADLAEFIRVMHPDTAWQTAADDCSRDMHMLVEHLNTNVKLYQAMRHALTTNGSSNKYDAMDEVDRRTANLFLFDFEQSGIHLPDKVREKVVKILDRILYTGSLFMAHTSEPRYVPKNTVPSGVLPYFSTSGDILIAQNTLSDVADMSVREVAYKAYLQPEREQDERFRELISLRYELAQLTGFQSYSERGLDGTLIRNYATLQEFLSTLSARLKPLAADDYEFMLHLKRAHYPAAERLYPWDISYYTALARVQHSSSDPHDLASYFPLGACVDGLSELLYRLFSVRLEIDTNPDELLWSPDVYKLCVVQYPDELNSQNDDKKNDPFTLGYIYCDFYERRQKPAQDCHFTIRCGRELDDGTYQLPIVVLCVGLPTPRSNGEPSLLQPGHLENLFHEMGHAIHSMLGRTRYQHVTGTRCPTDFAEVPSTLLELFANDERVLSRISSHYVTGEKLSSGGAELAKYCQSKRLCSAAELQLQTVYAIADQAYYGRDEPSVLSTPDAATAVFQRVFTQHHGLPYVKNTAWQLRFGHLFSYGGRYYSYLLSKAVAALMWKQLFSDDPYCARGGRQLREHLLIHGGERHPYELVTSALGFEPKVQDLVDSVVTLTSQPHYTTVTSASKHHTASGA